MFDRDDASTRSRFNAGEVVYEAAVASFDDWAQSHDIRRIDIVKIDVEGSEYDVLLGMAASIATHRPRSVVVELQKRRLDQAGRDVDDVLCMMRAGGYSVWEWLPGDNVVFRPTVMPSSSSRE